MWLAHNSIDIFRFSVVPQFVNGHLEPENRAREVESCPEELSETQWTVDLYWSSVFRAVLAYGTQESRQTKYLTVNETAGALAKVKPSFTCSSSYKEVKKGGESSRVSPT